MIVTSPNAHATYIMRLNSRVMTVRSSVLGYVHRCDYNTSFFSFQHQLSTARAECESNAKEISQHRETISEKEEEIKILFQQLQKEEALIAKLDMESAVAREAHGGAKRELELEEHILKVMDEAAELRNKLEEVIEEKQEMVRKMETVHLESEQLQCQVAELREQQAALKVSYMVLFLC